MPINTANATWLSGDDVEPRLCDCPKFVPWHRGPAEYNLTTTNLLLPSHFEGVWGIPPAAGGKQDLSNSHYKPLGLKSKKASGFPWSLEAWLGFIRKTEVPPKAPLQTKNAKNLIGATRKFS